MNETKQKPILGWEPGQDTQEATLLSGTHVMLNSEILGLPPNSLAPSSFQHETTRGLA